jgi:3-deoxy-manno-octulosonate cytidylyltransferase (CMP-KDO synthetase)
MSVIAVIPARYASTRFPAKPLARNTGKYLIQHVVEQVNRAQRITRCIVATDDQRIADAVRSFGGHAAMTRQDHPSGTDRIAEVVNATPGNPSDLILNVQGDEPEIEPAYLDQLIARMQEDPACPIGTLACPFPPDADPDDPNAVKVVINRAGRALYFSRARIPYPRADAAAAQRLGWLLHLGVYAYRRDFLLQFASWPPSALERMERLEQLRVLDNGYPIAVEVVQRASLGIDTPADYEAFVARCPSREQ